METTSVTQIRTLNVITFADDVKAMRRALKNCYMREVRTVLMCEISR